MELDDKCNMVIFFSGRSADFRAESLFKNNVYALHFWPNVTLSIWIFDVEI